MTKPPVTKIGILFDLPVEVTNGKVTREAYNHLRDRIIAYADALKKDANIIVADSFVTMPGEVFKGDHAADTTEKRLEKIEDKGNGHQKPAAKVEKKAEPVKATPKAKVEEEERPKVVAVDLEAYKQEKAAAKVEVKAEKVAPTTPVALNEDAVWLERALEHAGRRSDKTVQILKAFIGAKKEVTADDIHKAVVEAGGDYEKVDIAAWLGQSAKKNPYITKTGHGKYQFKFEVQEAPVAA